METEDLIYLITCAVNQETPDPERTAGMDLDALFDLASRHSLAAAAAPALKAAGINDERFENALRRSVLKNITMDAEMGRVFTRFSEAGIWHMPLKGIILQHLYPVYGMRQMSDHDFLVDPDRMEDVRGIMEGLGFSTETFGTSHHDVYFKKPVSNFQMHTTLFDPDPGDPLYNYYLDVYKRLLGEGYEKHFSTEDFYLYITAHEYHHYINAGTGLRSLLDIYVYLRNETPDMAYVSVEAEKMGIAEFEKANRSLAQHLFTGEELTKADREMLEYILSSGTYGILSQRVENEMSRHGWSKARFFLNRFLAPVNKNSSDYLLMTAKYPFFYKHKILLPFLLFYRAFQVIKTGRFRSMIKAIMNAR